MFVKVVGETHHEVAGKLSLAPVEYVPELKDKAGEDVGDQLLLHHRRQLLVEVEFFYDQIEI